MALDQITWGGTPDNVDLYVLLTVVGDLTSSDARIANISRGVATINPVAAVEGYFSEASIPMFYGKFPKNQNNLSPRGMSGGPIFAIKFVDGSVRYWLHAIQSQWVSGTREISGCPVFQIVELISRTICDIENNH